jgi:hypothetical protein
LTRPTIGDAGVLVERDGNKKYLSIKLSPQMTRLITVVMNASLDEANIDKISWNTTREGEQLVRNPIEWKHVCSQASIGAPKYDLYAKVFSSILHIASQQKKLDNARDVLTLWTAFLVLSTCFCYSFDGTPDLPNQEAEEIRQNILKKIKDRLHGAWGSV